MKLNKIFALVIALVMMTMSLAAFAAGNEGRTAPGTADNTYTGTDNRNATSVASGTTIPLTKSIVFSNLNDGQNVSRFICTNGTGARKTADES